MIAPPTGIRYAEERRKERLRMVLEQMVRPEPPRRPVRDPRVLAAMRAVPRHRFLPNPDHPLAYGDGPLAIDCGQTISQPYIVAIMTEFLELKPGSKVLEIGTGSGYQAAVLACITPRVFTVETVPELAVRADATLSTLGFDTVHRRHSDGADGWPEEAPFDAVLVACAMRSLPPRLWAQVRTGGRIVAPIRARNDQQWLFVLGKNERGACESRAMMAVSFVPMVGPSQADRSAFRPLPG